MHWRKVFATCIGNGQLEVADDIKRETYVLILQSRENEREEERQADTARQK